MKNFVEKYRPKRFKDLIGQEEPIKIIKEFLLHFPKGKKVLLLNGGPGVGKTTMVHVLSNENNAEIFELNASDLRNKRSLQEKLKPVLQQKSLFEKDKIILVDEVDGISGSQDRGGISELINLISKTPYPIICTANDAWVRKLAPLRKKSQIIELNGISPSETKTHLKDILKKENKQISETTLNTISIKARGDLRSALNDLEAVSNMGENVDVKIDERNKKIDIFKAIRHIFQDRADEEMLGTFDKVDMPIDQIILWVEENIPKVYQKEELARAYQRLSNVDLFKGRIYKRQYWRFLVYENIFLSYGIAQSKKDSKKEGFYKYSKPARILKIWMNNQKYAKRKTIAKKYAQKTHVGTKRILAEWKIIEMILKNSKVQKELKLDGDEIEYLMK